MYRRLLAFICAALPMLGQAVSSAQVTHLDVVPERNRIDVTVANTGQRPITAFYLQAYTTRNGEKLPCGGRGQDMIDGSDPMPGTQLLVHVARHWIMPGQDRKMDLYPGSNCKELPIAEVKVEVQAILFEDGTGEGASSMSEMALTARNLKATERTKWLPAFSDLRQASDLSAQSLKLYQAIVQANYTADLDPNQASQEGVAKSVRIELQNLALTIHEWAAHSQSPAKLEQNQILAWRLTDLEQRTVRLMKGAGQ